MLTVMHVHVLFCVKHALTILPVCLKLCGFVTGFAAGAGQSKVQSN